MIKKARYLEFSGFKSENVLRFCSDLLENVGKIIFIFLLNIVKE